ncbi:glycosyltransferase family 2 protein [Nanoarchaeota archaeon]
MKKVTVLIPCYNEERGVKEVIKGIPISKLKKLGYKTKIIVIDNNSSDNTRLFALKAGAKVIFEGNQGKGNAIITGFNCIDKDTDIVVMIDGDASYDPSEMLRLIEPLENKFCDVVIGSRLTGKIEKKSMPFFNRTGNWFFTVLTRITYCNNVTDVCTGYFAWNRKVIETLKKHLESDGFSIEMEMIAKMSKLNYSLYSVPISYNRREGETKLMPVRDGIRILHAWARNILWSSNKKTYFTKKEPLFKFPSLE